MPIIKLLNGSQRTYDGVVSIIEIAKDIKLSLSKSCVAGIVNGKLVDINTLIKDNAHVIIVNNDDNIGLEIIRYSCSQLLGYTVKKMWPKAKIADNNFTKNGFYCDVDVNHSIQMNDIKLIEKNMLNTIKGNLSFTKKSIKWKDAYNFFVHENDIYKMFMLKNNFQDKKIIDLYYYKNYFSICTNIQVPDINFCRYFQLEKVSGAYWQGNRNNKMLQRIYGTAWNNKIFFKKHIINLEKAKKRDHRIISKKLDLYHMQDESPGMIFWHHNGWTIFKELENFIREKLKQYHYQEVKTPLILDQCIWDKSGHLNNYFESIFTTSSENRQYCIKPMNCPGHIQIFNQRLRSYRELPLRISEFGICHRNEFSGSLHGLMRVRGFTQDDAHIFCTEDQIQSEIHHCIIMIYDIYKTFGFEKISVKLSTRPKKRIGNDITWDRAEQYLIEILKKNNLSFEYQVGEGAFYGPKIEFILHDCLERVWQCGTIQLDFYLPTCLNTFYIDRNNKRKIPIIIHRAILGSIERFIGILIEQYAGLLPLWLAPVHIVAISVIDKYINYVKDIVLQISNANIRIQSDFRNITMSTKIRDHVLNYVPYILICGEKEVQTNTISIRSRTGRNITNLSIKSLIEQLKKIIHNRTFLMLEE